MVALINFMMWPPAQATMAESAILSIDSASMGIDNEKSLPIETEFTISGGYRRDDLDWNIAGDTNGSHPNILTELTWDDVESYQVKFQGNLIWPKIMALRGSVAYGWIFDGENQDSDYRGDNRNLEFSRSNNSTEDGYVLNVNFDYQDWSTDNGTSKVFFADGTTAKTKLNEVNWSSYALMMGLSLRF